MQPLKLSVVIAAFAVFSLIGCSENTDSLVAPASKSTPLASTQQSVQSSAASLNDANGPLLHSVEGSANLKYDGKIIQTTITAHEYQDGTVGGQYEINTQALFQTKWHGKVLFLKVYNDIPGYGTIAMVGGQIKTSSDPAMVGLYDCCVYVDNGKSSDLASGLVPMFSDIARAQQFWNADPLDLINGFDTSWGSHWPGADLVASDMGNLHIR